MTANSVFANVSANAIALFARLVTAVRAIWDSVEPVPSKRIYFANHTSNGDFVLILVFPHRSGPPLCLGKRRMTCSPLLDHPAGDLPGVWAQSGSSIPEPFISEIGGLFPIALWGRTSL